MKKSLLALAVLGAFAGAASAQSSVTLFGVVDLNGRIVKNDGADKRLSLSQDGIASSRIGFRGIEDLGGGLKAGFWLEGGVNADTGTTNSKFFNRRSTVSLISNAGELRLGRDYTPTFWNTTVFDAFGTNGIGSSLNVSRFTHVRQDNAIQYFLPSNLGGFYGQFMAAAGEATVEEGLPSSLDKSARYIGGRLGFAAGPFDVAVSVAQERFGGGAVGIPSQNDDKLTVINVGGAWDFGGFKLMGYVERAKGGDAKETKGSISGLVRMGQSELHVGGDYARFDPSFGDDTAKTWQAKVTYQYNLSKRTAMYGTVSFLNNKDLPAGVTPLAIAGGYAYQDGGSKSKAAEFGVRHIF